MIIVINVNGFEKLFFGGGNREQGTGKKYYIPH